METIVILPPADVASLKAPDAVHSMDAVAAELVKLHIEYLRGSTTMDPGDFPPARITAISGLPAHEQFVLPSNGAVVVHDLVSVSQKAVPTPPATQ